MSKRGKSYRGQSRRLKSTGGCNCFLCTGGDKRYEVHHLQKIKNKKDWSEDEDQNLDEDKIEKD
jgi:queuine/archaeosine tRNA-ribosyltransferase